VGDAGSILEWTPGERAFHVEIDTGMGRAGVAGPGDEVVRRWIRGVRGASLTSFRRPERRLGERQLERFWGGTALAAAAALLHVANSAGAARDASLDLVRPAYFCSVDRWPAFEQPRPVVSVRARVLSVRRVRQGESVSYSASWVAPATPSSRRSHRYADGVRATSEYAGAQVLLRGKRCSIVGFVQMDMTLVDTGAIEVQVGDIATIVGKRRSNASR